ncbi:hypothetical protein SPHFLASMR4Y_01302 [Sphingorhabdus sp. SMR4y]|nr:hypothetical protein SPHFLASMR4Y_01302 [Sphingorhabdus sp. SMR4y]
MLAIAISTFFVLAFLGSATVIAMMFAQYRDRIAEVIQGGLDGTHPATGIQHMTCRQRTVRMPQPMTRHCPRQPAPLRAAA